MPLSQATIRRCFHYVKALCQCQRENHGHQGRCEKPLTWKRQGRRAPGGWFAVPWNAIDAGGPPEPENIEVLCWRCYETVMEQAGDGQAR